jgi:multidrug efflux pump subunit AcrA (membrane-fusion protein)
VAFRDQTAALREQLEAAQARIATLEKKNAELAARHSPLVRSLALGLGVVLVLASGLVWHVLMQNRGLALTARQDESQVRSLREDLDQALGARESAENAVLAAEASCRERIELVSARSRDRARDAMRAGPSAPPTPSSPSRYFWVQSATGRADVQEGDACVVTLTQEMIEPGHNECGLEVVCGDQDEIALVPPRSVHCRARADGWAELDDDDDALRIAMRGPQIGVRDQASTWQLMLANRRPCR